MYSFKYVKNEPWASISGYGNALNYRLSVQVWLCPIQISCQTFHQYWNKDIEMSRNALSANSVMWTREWSTRKGFKRSHSILSPTGNSSESCTISGNISLLYNFKSSLNVFCCRSLCHGILIKWNIYEWNILRHNGVLCRVV